MFVEGSVDTFALAGVTFGIDAVVGASTAKLCFTAGTEISTEGGLKPIEEIEIGDKVWSYNEQTGETSLKEVVALYESEKYNLVEVTVDGEIITSTDTHPYFVHGKGWIRADELEVGDILIDVNGDEVIVQATRSYTSEEPVTVYNFEVEDNHTYFVGQQQVLVHNKCTDTAKKNGHMLGTNGTQVSSKTTWKNGKTERIDVENPAPGKRPGQIHYHDSNNNKYYYDVNANAFYNQKTGMHAPNNIQKLLESKEFKNGINKALQILGE